ncbi:ribonuclease E/G [Maritimibacter alkaliphilus]|uniref:Rne/Rng family ribonuclease n=1 Tax=Maritimibacter alkaliphilus TaxID=404236 RepID=UPI001C951410|nr:ribonuclease E/G [Maritimibacter alkaliphilus]MBY6089354.1 Rne/Rng family ribonuclease [Maritimibacter alkaliphilus]
MAKKMLIDATHAEETRVVVVDGNKVEEFDFESENKRQLAGNIYLAKVTRVEPSLQAAFVDYGGNRHGFLAFSEIHPDYYQIPVADREALMEEERAYAEAMKARDEAEDEKKSRPKRSRSRSKAAKTEASDAVETREIEGMETIDTSDEDTSDEIDEGTSPMMTVAETPVEEPAAESDAGEADMADDQDGDDQDSDDDEGDDDAPSARSTGRKSAASEKDSDIESVADDDDHEDIRPPRKPRPKRYKIQEVIKVRQILLVQVVKEERGNKGAALTTYLSLAGRYCVLMPNTARGGGISRKITNAVDRKKLKEIAAEIDVPTGAGLIVRTAGAKRTKSEIKRDYEYLQRLWEQIRELTLKSIAPAKIYEEGDLIKRSIRDLYSRDIDEVLVEGERGYRNAKDFMKMIMPSHAKNVKHYQDGLPLFARYQVESYLAGMFNPVVQLKSGGYIVIGVTEALVAIDVNSGRATKEGSIEETATKTNLEAAEEVARQLRLRDLAGLIVIDFIDMDERKNNAAVEKKLKDKLKTDRARIQVGRISGFGLLEMSRQRLRPGMIEATTQPCSHCHGTGLIRSDDNMALSVLRQIEEEGTRRRTREVLVKVPVGIANYLMNQKREHVALIEGRYGMAVRIEGDPLLVSPDFSMEKFKTATRVVTEIPQVISIDTTSMEEDEDEDIVDEVEVEEAEEATTTEEKPEAAAEDDQKPKKRRRRRRRRKSSGSNGENGENGSDDTDDASSDDASSDDAPKLDAEAAEVTAGEAEVGTAEAAPEAEEKPKKTRSRSRGRAKKAMEAAEAADAAEAQGSTAPETPAEVVAAAPAETSDAPAPTLEDSAAVDSTETAATEAEAPAEIATPVAEVTEPEAPAEPVVADVPSAPEGTEVEVVEVTAEPEVAAEVADAPAEQVAADTPAEETVAEEAVADAPVEETPAEAPVEETVAEAVAPAPEPEPVAAEEAPAKPKRRGWWNAGR